MTSPYDLIYWRVLVFRQYLPVYSEKGGGGGGGGGGGEEGKGEGKEEKQERKGSRIRRSIGGGGGEGEKDKKEKWHIGKADEKCEPLSEKWYHMYIHVPSRLHG